jgi:hypothetical protein
MLVRCNLEAEATNDLDAASLGNGIWKNGANEIALGSTVDLAKPTVQYVY